MSKTGWKTVWWFPLWQRRTGWYDINAFHRTYCTAYRWRHWRGVVLEQSEDLQGRVMQTVRLPSGEEIVRVAKP